MVCTYVSENKYIEQTLVDLDIDADISTINGDDFAPCAELIEQGEASAIFMDSPIISYAIATDAYSSIYDSHYVSPPFYRQEVRSEETNASCGLASERPIVKPSPTVLHSDLICVSGGDHKHRPRDQGVGYVSELVDAGLFDREPVDATKPVPDRLH